MSRFADDRQDFGQIDFRRGFLVIRPQRLADFVAAGEKRVVQPP